MLPLCLNHALSDARCSLMARILLSAGADPNLREPDGRSALHFAAEFAQPSLCEALLAAGADPDARSLAGESPLDRLTRFSHLHGPLRSAAVESVFERRALDACSAKGPARGRSARRI